MKMVKTCLVAFFATSLLVLQESVNCDGYLYLKPGALSRLPRSNTKNNEEFEKFFLKASKSVPRIGRRGSVMDYPDKNSFNQEGDSNPYNFQQKRSYNLGGPFWSDIAQIYEYNPDLPNILERLAGYEEQGDDPSAYFTKLPYKRKPGYGNSKEMLEYRSQA